MKLDIQLIDSLEHNCLKGLIASVAEWKKKEYEFAHAEAWDFVVNYEIKTGDIIATLDIPNTLNGKLLKSYTGISRNRREFNKNKEEFMTTVKSELAQQLPIIIELDYFWCPWSKDVSNITHRPNHASLVVGFDEFGLNCLDYSPRCDKCTLPYENISKIDKYSTIKIDNPTCDTNYNDLIIRSINVIESHDIFKAMREFGNYIEESFNPIKCLADVENNAWLPNLWQLNLIAESRCLYSKTLRAISGKEKMVSLHAIAERLESTKPMWTNVSLILTKIYLTNDLSLRKTLAKKIYEIADFEEDIYCSLVSIIKGCL